MNKRQLLQLLLSSLLLLTLALAGLVDYGAINSILQPQNTVKFPFDVGAPWPTLYPTIEGMRDGLAPGDCLVFVDGKPFAGIQTMLEAAASRQHGDSVPIVVRKRSGATVSLRVSLQSPTIKADKFTSGLVAATTLGFPLLGLFWAFSNAFKQPSEPIPWICLGCAISLQHLLASADSTWPYPPNIAACVYLVSTMLGQSFVMFGLLLAHFCAHHRHWSRSHRRTMWLLVALNAIWISMETIGNANRLFSSTAGNLLITLQQTLSQFSYVFLFALVALICSLIVSRFSISI